MQHANSGSPAIRRDPTPKTKALCFGGAAVMGFAGILISAHQPDWDYDPSCPSTRPEEQTRLDL